MPYNPGIANRSGEYFAAGLSRGLSAISRGLEMRQQNIERLQEEDKQAAKETKRYRVIARGLREELGLSDAQIENSTGDELAGAVEGHFIKQAVQKHKAQMEALGANLELNRQNLMAAQHEAGQREAMRAYNERLSVMPGYPDPDTAAKMMAMEGLDAPSQATLMQGRAVLARSQDQLSGSAEPVVSDRGGVKTVFSPRTGQFNVVEPEPDMTAKPIPGAPGYLQIGRHVVKQTGDEDQEAQAEALSLRRQLRFRQLELDEIKALKAKGVKAGRIVGGSDSEAGSARPASKWPWDLDDWMGDLISKKEEEINVLKKRLERETKEPKQGDTRIQNGLIYIYDGKEFKPMGPAR